MKIVAAIVLIGCASTQQRGPVVTLRAACAPGELWTGAACTKVDAAHQKLADGIKALAAQDIDAAKAALDAAEQAGPLDHDANITLWEQRGIAAAYVDDEPGATSAFDMMLALDPNHLLSYTLSPKATFVFEKIRTQAPRAPELDVNWSHGQKVGDAVPLDVDVVADPKRFLHRATVFVRTRGEASYRAADLELGATGDHRLTLPPVQSTKPISLELYVRAYDAKGNEVLAWADPAHPREIALRYEPPPPWYRKWWVITIAASALAVATGIIVYELTIAPPDTVGGGVTVR